MRKNKYLLAIPAYNEAPSIIPMVTEAKRYIHDILVVDDGSSDTTPQQLAEIPDIIVHRHATNLGYGQSLRDAFDCAIDNGYDWLITMDCDEQHEPSAIPRFTTAAEERDVDIVSGSRYYGTAAPTDAAPPERRRINRRITSLLNNLFAFGITDAFCGFKAYRTEALKQLSITETGYAMPLQLWVQAARANLRVVEIPVRLIYNDPMRRFGGGLDDAEARYAHYMDVLNTALIDNGMDPISADVSLCDRY